jgi:branched-chain amino acid transport system ATP-binding protein
MVLAVENIDVEHDGRTILRDISLTLKPGTVTAVLGANGAGKSELIKALAGILPITNGTYELDGRSLRNTPAQIIRQRGVAAVPEGHRVFTALSVDDNLRAAGSLLADDLESILNDTYAIFPELAERKKQLAGTMSGGQQQMLALGHAMMSKPNYMLIDEMSLGLAPLIVKRLIGFVDRLKDRGIGVLLIEQFAELALKKAEHALVLRNGKLTYSGDAKNLLDDPGLLDRSYFGALNID